MRNSPPHDERTALILAGAAVLGWSTVATAFKLGLAVMSPQQLLMQGCVFSTLVFVVANSWLGSWKIDVRVLREAALLGVLNPFLYYQVLFAAYDRLPAQLAQSVNYTWAIVLAVLGVPLLGQRLSFRLILGIGVSYGGVLIVTLGINAATGLTWDRYGLSLALGSTLVWAVYWLLSARSRVDALPLMTWSFLFATPLIAIVCRLDDGWPRWDVATLPYGAWVGLIEMGFTYLLWSAALRRTANAARIAQLIFLSPFLSLLLIERVLHEPVPLSSWVGLFVIIIGVVLARGRDDGHATEHPT